jgi:hypothetical protein
MNKILLLFFLQSLQRLQNAWRIPSSDTWQHLQWDIKKLKLCADLDQEFCNVMNTFIEAFNELNLP